MTSPAAVRRARVWSPLRWTLRTRLLASLIALLATVSVVIGLVSVLSLNAFLVGRLDDSLQELSRRSTFVPSAADQVNEPRLRNAARDQEERSASALLGGPGQNEGAVIVVVKAGAVTDAAILRKTDFQVAPAALTGQERLSAVAVDGRPHTVSVEDGMGDYRVIAAQDRFGRTVIAGLPLREVDETVGRLALVITLVALAGLILAAFLGGLIIRLTLRPLRRVAATATRVSELPLHEGEVALAERVPDADTDPRTEVGQVGAALNTLLGHVSAALTSRHASETRVRQFVADASHELRTPLASIRGYAELTRRVREPVPAVVAHALTRVESESIRMTGMVEDLLLLARLDSGPAMETRDIDLSRVVVDAVSDASAAGPDHVWRLKLPDEPVHAWGEPARLHQVLTNLLANARTHTPPGTEVTVTLASETEEAARWSVLRVTDNGPGIPKELQADVFERFARGDTSRSRAAGSTGLGLAIVAAVVGAHGGTVSVQSEPGRTEFSVRLPAAVEPVVADTTS